MARMHEHYLTVKRHWIPIAQL